MKHLLMIAILGFSFSAMAEVKIGYVDMQKAIQSTKAGKKARASLEKEFKAKEKQLKKKEEELKKMSEDLQKKAALLSESARKKQAESFQREMLKFRQDVSQSQQSIAEKERKMTEPIIKKMYQAIDSIAKKENYTMILEKREQNILWAAKQVDITDEVVKAFEK